MFYAWFLEQCYLSGSGITTKKGPGGEILRAIFEDMSPAEFEFFLEMWNEYKELGE